MNATVPVSATNLRFHRAAQACRSSHPLTVVAMQQLSAAEPFTTSGVAASGWLLKHFGPRPLPTPEELAAGNALLVDLFGEDAAALLA